MSLALIKDQLALQCAQVTGMASGPLTGTVSKASGSTTLTGIGTAFTTELRKGDVVSIPGTTVEYFVVQSITDNTHLTVGANAANNASGQIATHYSVYRDSNWRPPTDAECPAIVIEYRQPPLNVAPLANSLLQYVWNFQINFLLAPYGVGLMPEWLQNVEPYPARLYAQFVGHNTLNGAATSIRFANSFNGFDVAQYRDGQYFMFTWDLSVFENVATAYAP